MKRGTAGVAPGSVRPWSWSSDCWSSASRAGSAAWFVIREAGRLAAEPPPPVFDMEEAFDWVVAHLPDLVAATLTTEDVRRILDFQLEFFQRKG